MSRFTLLRGARQLLTLAGPEGVRRGSALQHLSVIPDGSVLIEDGLIAEVGSTRRLENLKEARSALEIDVHGSVVMPGFVDPSLRVTLNNDPHGAVHRPKRMGRLYDETLDLLRSCVLHGTLSAELKGTAALADYRSDLGVLRRLAKIGDNPARTMRCWQLTRVPQSEAETSAFCEILLKLARKSLIHFVELALDNDFVLGEALLAGLQVAGVGIKLLWNGSSASALGRALNQLHPFALFCVKPLLPEELVLLQSYGGTIVFAPGRGPGDPGLLGAREAMEAGLAVALSSGYDAVSFAGYSMQMAVSLASVYGRLTLEQAITAATVNAAHTLGCGDTQGCLMKGRAADLIVLSVPDYREIPRQFGINNVRMAIRDGNVVVNRSGWKIGTHEPVVADRVRTQRVGGP